MNTTFLIILFLTAFFIYRFFISRKKDNSSVSKRKEPRTFRWSLILLLITIIVSIMKSYAEDYETLLKKEENFYRLHKLNEELIEDFKIDIWNDKKYASKYKEIDYHKHMSEVNTPIKNLNLIYYIVIPLILIILLIVAYESRDKVNS